MDAKNSTESKPNVIWIFGDQHRFHALSCNGDPNVNTPNIDRLSATGVSFTRAVAGFPLCCPFRGSLLTSRYPHKCIPGHNYGFLSEMPLTIADVFNGVGYDTAYFGKWHVDGTQLYKSTNNISFHIVPPSRRGGFKTWIGYENNNSQWDSWVHGHNHRGEELERYRLPGYETDELTNLFIHYLN